MMSKQKSRSDMRDDILHVNGLSKSFGDFEAVKNVDFEVKRGEIFGFLGPNGAGKTTTIKMLVGLLQPGRGKITIDGFDMAAKPLSCKEVTGYIPDRPFLYEKLTGDEYLRFISSLYPEAAKGRALVNGSEYLKIFDLEQWQNHLIEGYSHGMRQKLIMSSILMLDQKLIVVDEPMVGLDPKSARIVKDLFKEKAARGTTIFLSTHSMEVAEELCDRITIISDGEIRASGTVEELRDEAGQKEAGLEDIFLELTGAYELQEVIKALKTAPAEDLTGKGA